MTVHRKTNGKCPLTPASERSLCHSVDRHHKSSSAIPSVDNKLIMFSFFHTILSVPPHMGHDVFHIRKLILHLLLVGRVVGVEQGLKELLNIPNSARVVNLKFPRPGAWKLKVLLCWIIHKHPFLIILWQRAHTFASFLKVSCSGRHTLRVTGVSNLDFRAGFSSVPVLEFNHTRERPIKGVVHVSVSVSNVIWLRP